MKISLTGWVGIGLIASFILMAIVGPWIAPFPPAAQNLTHFLEEPSRGHLLGTDENGCDVLSQLFFGARLALLISLSVVLICLALGSILGAAAGFVGGWFDEIIMRVIDVFLAFPGILLNLALVALLPRSGIGLLIVALSINGWVSYARIARAETRRLRRQDFVLSAESLGVSRSRLFTRHLVPNISAPLLVQATFHFSAVIVIEASLAFLGVGRVRPYSWGALLAQGTTYLWRTSHLIAVPGIAIGLVVLGANLAGDSLTRWLDPTAKKRLEDEALS